MPLDVIQGSRRDDPFEKFNESSTLFFPVIERKLSWNTKTGDTLPITSHKAIVRVSNNKPYVLNIVGSTYRLVHNKELFSAIEQTLRKKMQSHELVGVDVKDHASGWGRTCYREYIFPNIKCTVGKTAVAFRLIAQNGYGGSALRLHAGAIDFFCTNGMIRGEFQSTYRKHTSGLTVHGIDEAVEKALITFADSQQLWQKWATTPVKHGAAMELFKKLANTAKLRENLSQQYMREREQRGDNMWAVYSALTYYASHATEEFRMRSTVEKTDNAAATMMQRELNVSKWVETPAWKQLETT